MRTSRRMLKQVRRAFAAALAFSGCINILSLATPLFALHVFQTAVPAGNLETLAVLGLIVAAAVAAIAVLDGVRSTILLRAGLWLDHHLGCHIAGNGLKRRASPAEINQDATALEHVHTCLTGGALAVLCDALWTPILVLALFVVHPVIGAIAAAAAVLMICAALLQIGLTSQLGRRSDGAHSITKYWLSGAAGAMTQSNMQALPDAALLQWERINRSYVAAAYALGTRAGPMMAASRAIKAGAQIALLAVGAWLIVNNEIAPAAVFASALLVLRALSPLDQVNACMPSLMSAYRGYQRLNALPGGIAPPVATGVAPHGFMSLNDVTYTYPGRPVAALSNLSLTLQPGECLAITGPNGSGKSTLAAIIAGAIDPGSGSAELDEIAIAKWQRSSAVPVIGYVPSEPVLLEGTVHANIALFQDADASLTERASQTAGVYEVLASLSDGFETIIGRDGRGLSLRERRAVSLARAVYGAPRVIVLDEPELGLDNASLRKLVSSLRALKEAGTSLVIATQDQRLIALASQVAVLNAGVLHTRSAGFDRLQAVVPASVAAGRPAAATMGGP